jgi:uncharacterized protein (TIGR00375 family)
MDVVADLHLHSKYSRAVSRDMNLPTMAMWAEKKGLNLVSTGDWTHPLWIREIKNELVEASNGLFKLKNNGKTLFLLSVEISSIYSQGGKVRRVHNLIFSPSISTSEKINSELVKRGCNLNADGRPIIGLSSHALAELIFSIDDKAMIIPCHAWTPWFSLYGSNSGFDSIEECFGEYSREIFAVETGLSSDPYMNWQIDELKSRSILSFSDAHSPMKMGREATVFIPKREIKEKKLNLTYEDIILAIKQDQRSRLKIGYTIEFYPEEGKYHLTGHRNCQYVQTPDQSRENGTICPKCKRPLTVGVMHRVEDLAKKKFKVEVSKENANGVKWIIDPAKIHPPFVKLVPLNEIIAESIGVSVSSLKVKDLYNKLTLTFGSELNILLKLDFPSIQKEAGERIAEAIRKVRGANIEILPGFDGQYGIVKIWKDRLSEKEETITSQLGIDF